MNTLTKEHKALLHFVAKTDGRPILTGVSINPETGVAVATDDFKLLAMPLGTMDAGDFPPTPGALPDNIGACILPAATVAQAIKGLPKKPVVDVLRNVKLTGNGTGKVVLTTHDLSNPIDLAVEPIRGTYPNYTQLIPAYIGQDSNAGRVTSLAYKHLKALVEAMRDMGCQRVRLQITSPSAPVRCDFAGEGLEGAVAVLMPMFVADDPAKLTPKKEKE